MLEFWIYAFGINALSCIYVMVSFLFLKKPTEKDRNIAYGFAIWLAFVWPAFIILILEKWII
jgi:hypothetical protein